jgi:hypothetical protein
MRQVSDDDREFSTDDLRRDKRLDSPAAPARKETRHTLNTNHRATGSTD